MSTALLSTPTVREVEGEDTTSPEQIFMQEHRGEVQRDFRDVIRLGIERLVVSPERRQDSSAVHKVSLTKDGEQLEWLKELYRMECPRGIKLRFIVMHKRPTGQPEYSTLSVTFVFQS